MSDEKVSAAPEAQHADATTSDPSKTHPDVIDHARSAAAKEQKMTLMQGIKLYPKAVGWSVLISTCIVMEGFDIVLVNNFCEFAAINSALF
jgi:SP family general alpha glucoside:H+ symporter-like MFS transporter